MIRDPFEVLGIPHDADERAIKKAYARLVRLHRPERDPEGFARVHAAYEAALAHQDIFDEDDEYDPPRVRVALDALPWAALRARLDDAPDAVGHALRTRFEELYEAGALDQVWAELFEPSLIDATLAHVELAWHLLPVVAAMAWYRSGAGRLHASLRAMPSEPVLARLLDFVDIEVTLAERFFRLRDTGFLGEVPQPLLRLFGDRLLASEERRLQVRREAVALLAAPARLLAFCDQLVAADDDLAGELALRLRRELPADLGPRVPGRLTARLVALGPHPWHVRARHSAASRQAAGFFESVNTWRRYQEDEPPDYRRRLRPIFAAMLADIGATAAALHERLAARPAESRYDGLVLELVAHDQGLDLLGTIAALSRTAPPS